MQAGLIVRGFIASPSDVQEYRDQAIEVVTRWNAVNSIARETVIEAIRLETHADAQLGLHPQLIINSTMLANCDFLIAIFWARMGTETPDAVSGTVAELEEFKRAKGGERVKLFFCEDAIPHDHDVEQFSRVQEFKTRMKSESLYIPFRGLDHFSGKLRDQLDIIMNAIDRSEQKAKLWSETARLTEVDELKIEQMRNHQRRMEELSDANMRRFNGP